MLDGPRGMAILRIFAARARAEIERARTEAALRESEERYRDLYDKAPGRVLVAQHERAHPPGQSPGSRTVWLSTQPTARAPRVRLVSRHAERNSESSSDLRPVPLWPGDTECGT